jgi:hypothetical protein
MWGSNDFAFHRPDHVDGHSRISLDEPLLKALLSLPETHERAYEALVEFNSANTDSGNIPDHVEVVMCKSAFEWLLKINSNAKSFVGALEARLCGIDPIDSAMIAGPLSATWQRRWQHETRLLHAWAKDLCAVRGTSAHGTERTDFVWGNHQHLAFIAIVFPLFFKKVLADEGLFTLDDYDLEHLRRIEGYLVHDPFDFDWDSDIPHSWPQVSQAAYLAARAKLF